MAHVAWPACLSVECVSWAYPCKTAEPIEMTFGSLRTSSQSVQLTRVGQRNDVLDGVEIHPRKWAILGVVWPTEKHRVFAAVYAAKGIIQSSTARHMMGFSSKLFDHLLVLLQKSKYY